MLILLPQSHHHPDSTQIYYWSLYIQFNVMSGLVSFMWPWYYWSLYIQFNVMSGLVSFMWPWYYWSLYIQSNAMSGLVSFMWPWYYWSLYIQFNVMSGLVSFVWPRYWNRYNNSLLLFKTSQCLLLPYNYYYNTVLINEKHCREHWFVSEHSVCMLCIEAAMC